MPKYWLISDRDRGGTGMGRNVSGLNFFVRPLFAVIASEMETAYRQAGAK